MYFVAFIIGFIVGWASLIVIAIDYGKRKK